MFRKSSRSTFPRKFRPRRLTCSSAKTTRRVRRGILAHKIGATSERASVSTFRFRIMFAPTATPVRQTTSVHHPDNASAQSRWCAMTTVRARRTHATNFPAACSNRSMHPVRTMMFARRTTPASSVFARARKWCATTDSTARTTRATRILVARS